MSTFGAKTADMYHLSAPSQQIPTPNHRHAQHWQQQQRQQP
jgi:hypothetical protein